MEEFIRDKYSFSDALSIANLSEEQLIQRQKQISLLGKEIFLYKVMFNDLTLEKPTADEKNLLLNIAFYISHENELFDKLQSEKRFQYTAISKITRIKKAFLEKWQDYIITYTIIFANPNYDLIQEYLKVQENIQYKNHLSVINPKSNLKGMIIKSAKRSNIILTSDGTFIRTKKSDYNTIGKEVDGSEKKRIKNLKIKLSIVVILLLMVAAGGYMEYINVTSTVVFTSGVEVKLEVNRYNKVMYTYSPSDDGKAIIKNLDPIEKPVDLILEELLQYSNENNLIDNSGVLVTINGRQINYQDLSQTRDYAKDKKLKVLINNVGNQQKLQ